MSRPDRRGGVLPAWVRCSSKTGTLTERSTGETIGSVRQTEGRWFAEHADGLPVLGTHPTRADAVDALLVERAT